MTLEEAQTLGPGDIITGNFYPKNRIIKNCSIHGIDLNWDEPGSDLHAWEYARLSIVKKVHNIEPQVNNDYSIF